MAKFQFFLASVVSQRKDEIHPPGILPSRKNPKNYGLLCGMLNQQNYVQLYSSRSHYQKISTGVEPNFHSFKLAIRLTFTCLVSTKRSHILYKAAVESCRFVKVCATFYWTPGTKALITIMTMMMITIDYHMVSLTEESRTVFSPARINLYEFSTSQIPTHHGRANHFTNSPFKLIFYF